MPARKYGLDADRPVHVPTRLPRVVLAYLHVIVRLKRPQFSYNSLAHLHEEIVRCFLALAPYSPSFLWKTPRAASADDDDLAFRQCNFQLAPALAHALKKASDQAGVTRATFLYTATYHYIEHVATPKALQLL
ncbi:hypothetical protein [Noviherbaspirillum malthae]|uniref:hypothetical protein n=1 Tax=Noviherbaspirillum malthae TaxID=1260987 RepID=UPI00188EFD41|nr:hypothetical protein [Noviherbaspirillum malthae]